MDRTGALGEARHCVSCRPNPEGRPTMLGAATPEPSSLPSYGPFVPGAESLPPCLAGRAHEQARTGEFLDIPRRGKPPPSAGIFFGPGGNGKAALLNWTSAESQHDLMIVFPDAHAARSRPRSASPRRGRRLFMSVDGVAKPPIRNAKCYGSSTNFAETRHQCRRPCPHAGRATAPGTGWERR